MPFRRSVESSQLISFRERTHLESEIFSAAAIVIIQSLDRVWTAPYFYAFNDLIRWRLPVSFDARSRSGDQNGGQVLLEHSQPPSSTLSSSERIDRVTPDSIDEAVRARAPV